VRLWTALWTLRTANRHSTNINRQSSPGRPYIFVVGSKTIHSCDRTEEIGTLYLFEGEVNVDLGDHLHGVTVQECGLVAPVSHSVYCRLGQKWVSGKDS
jgi:hypothetical protein